MWKAGCILALGAVVGTGCHDSTSGVGGRDAGFEPRDFAVSPPAPPSDLRGSPISDLGPSASDLALEAPPDLTPPAETVALCPSAQQTDIGTNSVVRVHATWLIDRTTVTAASLVVQLAGAPIAGSLAVTGQDLQLTPSAPLPAGVTLQATLAGDVRDTLGRPLAPGGSTWSFTTGTGEQATEGYKFMPPLSPSGGDHAVQHAVARDGTRTVIAWSTGNFVMATSLDVDAAELAEPLTVSHPDIGLNNVSVSAADGMASFAYVMTVNSPLVYWSRAADDWQTPAQERLLIQDNSLGPSVAVAPGGKLAIAWSLGDIFEKTGYLVTSSDGGDSFATPMAIDTFSDCPQALYQDGRLVVAWFQSGEKALKAMSSSDNGASFSAPVVVASVSNTWGCPQLVDAGNGDVLMLYDDAGAAGARSTMLGRYTPATDAVGVPSELHSSTAIGCASLVASPSGKLVLALSSEVPPATNQWTNELRTSDDHGQTFGKATTPEVIDAFGACPLLTLTDDDLLTMAWRRKYFQLQVSRGHPRRPCE